MNPEQINHYQKQKDEFLKEYNNRIHELESESYQLFRSFDEAHKKGRRMKDNECFSASGLVNQINQLAAKAQFIEMELNELKEQLRIKTISMYRSKD